MLEFLKKKRSLSKVVEEDSELIVNTSTGKEPYEGIIEQGSMNLIDVLSPSSISTKNSDCMIIDSTFLATIMIVGFPYERFGGWLADIINYGEGVEVNLYYEPLEKSKIIKEVTEMIGFTGAKKKAIGENQSDMEIVDTSLGHARYMRKEMNINQEDPYNFYALIQIYADDKEQLEDRYRAVSGMLEGSDILTRRADFRHEFGTLACLPLHQLSDDIKKATRRNALSTGLASTYPFVSVEFSDDNGILIGKNEHNNSLVIVDFFNSKIYKNANVVIMGTSGAGKTFLMQLIALRLRQQDIQTMIIAPLKGLEFRTACEAIGGTFLKIAPGSADCINIFDIRKSTVDQEFEDDDFTKVKENSGTSLLLAKIQKLHIFFSLLFPDMTQEEKQDLDEKLIEVYEKKGITFDDNSIYSNEIGNFVSTERKYKEMPLLEDLFELLAKDLRTERLSRLMKMLVKGSLKNFNQHTNVNLENKYIVADISELNDELLTLGMFIVIDIFWDKIKEDRTKKKSIFVDEAWKLISGGSKKAAQFILEIFKTIRGYGGSAVAATQDITDFFALEDGKYSKGIINNSKIKFVLQMEEDEAKSLEKVLKLSEEEIAKITTFERGHGLFYAGNNHAAVEFVASSEEKDMITSDRAELEEIKKRQSLKKLMGEI